MVGRVTDDGRMRIRFHGAEVVDIPVDPIAKSSPELDRPVREPADLRERQKLDLASVAPEADLPGALDALLDSPNLGSKAWIYRQYDQLVQGNTVLGPGGDAALVRVKLEDGTPTQKGLALAVDCNPLWCWLDPYTGTLAAVAEAARNVACTGARPLALSNCLNFGNPEKPEIMWEFAEATRGLADAARALGTPVVSGNVSFYNETSGRAIHPTPTIAMVGLLEPWERHATSHFSAPGARDRAARAHARGARRLGVARAAPRARGGASARRGSRSRAPPRRPAARGHRRRSHRERARRLARRARGGARALRDGRADADGRGGGAGGLDPARCAALWRVDGAGDRDQRARRRSCWRRRARRAFRRRAIGTTGGARLRIGPPRAPPGSTRRSRISTRSGRGPSRDDWRRHDRTAFWTLPHKPSCSLFEKATAFATSAACSASTDTPKPRTSPISGSTPFSTAARRARASSRSPRTSSTCTAAWASSPTSSTRTS